MTPAKKQHLPLPSGGTLGALSLVDVLPLSSFSLEQQCFPKYRPAGTGQATG